MGGALSVKAKGDPLTSASASVALVSHRGGNIGHDVMALGVEECVAAAFPELSLEIVHLEHHHPFQLYRSGTPVRLLDRRAHGKSVGLKRFALSGRLAPQLRRFVDTRHARYAAAIVCGGPAIHAGAGSSPDMEAMYLHMTKTLADLGVPVLNLSVGSCYPQELVPTAIPDAADREFHRRVLEIAAVTTVRDSVARDLYAELGWDVPFVSDTGIAAGSGFERLSGGREARYVVLNIQPRGANEDWGQGVDPDRWQRTAGRAIEELGRRHELRFVCHADVEEQLAARLAPSVERLRPETMHDYARILDGAVAGLTNRIHAAIALASVGVPSAVVGTDTRLGTVERLGLPVFYVKEADADRLVERVEGLIANAAAEAERLRTVRETAVEQYAGLIRSTAA